MHAGIANQQFPLNSVARKTFPAFPVHAQPAILRIWQEDHCLNQCWLISGIPPRAISQEVLMNLICNMCSKITLLKLQLQFPGAIELMMDPLFVFLCWLINSTAVETSNHMFNYWILYIIRRRFNCSTQKSKQTHAYLHTAECNNAMTDFTSSVTCAIFSNESYRQI